MPRTIRFTWEPTVWSAKVLITENRRKHALLYVEKGHFARLTPKLFPTWILTVHSSHNWLIWVSDFSIMNFTHIFPTFSVCIFPKLFNSHFDAYQERVCVCVCELFVKVVCPILFSFFFFFFCLSWDNWSNTSPSSDVSFWHINDLIVKWRYDWCSVFAFWNFVPKVLKTKTNKYVLKGLVALEPSKTDSWTETIQETKWCANFWCDVRQTVSDIFILLMQKNGENETFFKIETWAEPDRSLSSTIYGNPYCIETYR